LAAVAEWNVAVMDQLFHQMMLSKCRLNASAMTRSPEQLNVSDDMAAAFNLTCEDVANEMVEWR